MASPSAVDDAPIAQSAPPDRIGGRYRVEREIGRGGTAVVYRVLDTQSGAKLALKRLVLASEHRRAREQLAAFEREYHTLIQLSHPRIIEVYDFGTDEASRYYTMELLDGNDLRDRAPLTWRDACAVAYDVCSSLALLHSRRLVHRDISPRNVRSTQRGAAKLIDFGAMVPMGAGGKIVGTPPFVSPEVLHRSTVDARTDLFSLGATLYYALTARLAYHARDFRQLQAVWAQRPAPPSAVVPDIPPALDSLVMSMLNLDPATRPRTAFEVMQRLATVAGLAHEETLDVTHAYLSTPVVVGRDPLIADLRARIELALRKAGSGALVEGPPGVGRTRMLDVCALESKVAGATVLRANAASENGEALAVAQTLAAQLCEALPELAAKVAQELQVADALFESPASGGANAALKHLAASGRGSVEPAMHSALTSFLLRMAERAPLAILVDDLHDVDEASLALLASLVLAAPSRRLIVVATAKSEVDVQAAAAFAIFRRGCAALALAPLGPEQTESLLGSLFGDVPNLALVSARLYEAARGIPGETLTLVQTLIARGVVRYEGGQWLLPGQLKPAELPTSAVELCRQRIAELSPLARALAEVHALASHPSLGRHQYALAAADALAADLDAAVSELVSKGVLAGDGRGYVLARREWASALIDGLTPAARVLRHRTLAELCAAEETLRVERVFHLIESGQASEAVDHMVELLKAGAAHENGILAFTSMSGARVGELLDRALTCGETLGRSRRDLYELRRGVFAVSVVSDEAYYYRAAPALFAQLAEDSGLACYLRITDAKDQNERLMRALTEVGQRQQTEPEAHVLGPEAAIKALAYYVAISIAIGSRTQDLALLATLPGVLEPFVGLSPLLHAMWQNAIATSEANRNLHPERAHRRWLQVDATLATLNAAEVNYLAPLRAAVAYGICLVEARLGVASAANRAKVLDEQPMQRASAMSLRRLARLHRGDLAGAEHYRKQAELVALHGNLRAMFTMTLTAELIAHARAGDLSGIREAAQTIAALAARFPGWLGHHHLADGYFEQCRGRFDAARAAFERGLAVSEPDANDPHRCAGAWLWLEGAHIETLLALDRADEARKRGLDVLARAAEHEAGVTTFVVRRALALAEATLGEYATACARLEEVIVDLRALDIQGLELGCTYEARARIAIWAADMPSVEHYARLTAQEYRHGQNSPLGARYERLMDEARRSGVTALPELADMQSGLTTSNWGSAQASASVVRTRLEGAANRRERAQRALALLCEAHAASSGHLYLSTPSGLELAASFGAGEPAPELQQHVTRYVHEQLDADDHATVIEPEGTCSRGAGQCDVRGLPYVTVLLLAEVEGVRLCAGAAVLETGARAFEPRRGHALHEALGDHLLREGDALAPRDARSC